MNLLLGQVDVDSRRATTEERRTNRRDRALGHILGFAKQAPKIFAKDIGLDVGDLDLQGGVVLRDGKIVVPEVAPGFMGDVFARQERIVV